MEREPVLATRRYVDRVPMIQIVHGGLHYIRGNNAPYFTLTSWHHRRGLPNQCQSGGCDHETILKHWPKFADLAALHLSDIDGVPMHAEGNGWYDLAGALGGFGEQYHVGNSERHFPLPAERRDPAKPWQNTEYRKPTPAECLQIFADHCRIGIKEAQRIADAVVAELGQPNEAYDVPSPYNKGDYIRAKNKWHDICLAMRPRWKKEAEACIAKHGLVVFGDAWTAA